MKKILSGVVVFLLLIGTAFAANLNATSKSLKDSSGTALSSYSLTNQSAVYSQTIRVQDNAGYATLLVTEDKPGGAGDVDISAEYSVDGTNWYTASVSDMAGTVTAEGNIVTALQNSTKWIVHTARLAPYMRYKFDPDADSRITVTHIYQEDR